MGHPALLLLSQHALQPVVSYSGSGKIQNRRPGWADMPDSFDMQAYIPNFQPVETLPAQVYHASQVGC